MKHLVSMLDSDGSEIERIVERSIGIKKEPEKYNRLLEGKKMYLLFQKTSTRTALSTSMAMNELGGDFFLQKWDDSNFAVGEIRDEIRYVARNVDIALARLKKNEDIELLAKYSPIPVINGCCNRFHPCQALADVMTVFELSGKFAVKLVYVGIWNNVFNSLLLTLPRLGGTVVGICPEVNESAATADMRKKAASFPSVSIYEGKNATPSIAAEQLIDADYAYTDTWIDMEFFNDPGYADIKAKRMKEMLPFQLNDKSLGGSHAAVLHDMPIHAGYEISRETVETHMDVILRQAENRRHVAKGIILDCLGI